MISSEQASILVREGLLQFQRENMVDPRQFSVLEFLIVARDLIDKAVDNGKLKAPWRTTPQRYKYLIEAAGVLNLALQHHGMIEFNLHQLRRTLHPQQSDKKSELLLDQFMRRECADVYKECFDTAQTETPYDAAAWERLKSCLERLGVQF